MKHTKCLIALLLGLCLLLGLTACTSSAPADTETPAAASDAETTASETTEETEEAAEPELLTSCLDLFSAPRRKARTLYPEVTGSVCLVP